MVDLRLIGHNFREAGCKDDPGEFCGKCRRVGWITNVPREAVYTKRAGYTTSADYMSASAVPPQNLTEVLLEGNTCAFP